MEQTDERRENAYARIAAAAGDMGLFASRGCVHVTVAGERDLVIDCTAADPVRLLEFLAREVFRRGFDEGAKMAREHIRHAIGLA